MICYCPFCGSWLNHPIIDSGITTCNNCCRVFDHSSKNKLLSATWACRKQNIKDINILESQFNLNQKELNFVKDYIIIEDLSHDEIIKLLKEQSNEAA